MVRHAGDLAFAAPAQRKGLCIPRQLEPLQLVSRQVDASRDDFAPIVHAPEPQRRLLLCHRRRVLVCEDVQERYAERLDASVLLRLLTSPRKLLGVCQLLPVQDIEGQRAQGVPPDIS